MVDKPIIIIGAGIGGLSTAIRLAASGNEVIVLEKNPNVGGKMYEHHAGNFRWDTGPSVITMKHVFEDLFYTVGRKLEDYLTLLPVEPLTRYFYPDGTILDASLDRSEMSQQITKLDKRDINGYQNYLKYAAEIHRVTGPVFIYNTPPTLTSFTKVPIWDWLKADPFRTMHGAIQRYVHSQHLRQLLARFATYVGGNPYAAPATLNVVADVELNGGVWYPQGGIYQIATALEKLAIELGVSIHTNCAVSKIKIEDNTAQGIVLEDQTFIESEHVISNVDVTTTLMHLISDSTIPRRKLNTLTKQERSCSGFVMMLGIDGTHEQLAHHNIFFSEDYEAEFNAIFSQKKPANDPTIYLAITSKTNLDHAPEGCENWFILVNTPALSNAFDWTQNTQAYRNLILQKLAGFGLAIEDKVLTEKILTPVDLQEMSGAWGGALYGTSPNSKFAAFRRPHNRSNDIRGLYFVGGTTHPGGGVPMVILSSKVTADFVLEDQHKAIL